MKIRILQSCSGINFSFSKSAVEDVDDALGKDLISAGYAEEVKESKPATSKAGAKKNADT